MIRFRALGLMLIGAALAGVAAAPATARPSQYICRHVVMSRFEPSAKRNVTVCATTALSTTKNYNFGPDQAVDSNPKTAWIEGSRGPGLGNWIMLRFEDVRPVRYLGIENGFGRQIDSTRWMEINRAKDVLIETSDGVLQRIRLKDTDQTQYIDLGRDTEPTWIRLTLLSVYRGTKYDDTALTEFWALPASFKPVIRDIVRVGVRPVETEPVSSP
jgi:hypothetical protein